MKKRVLHSNLFMPEVFAAHLWQDRVSTILLVLVTLFFSSCNSESAPDCFQSAGKIVRQQIDVPVFTKITVFENVSLILKQGEEQKVEIETGQNLLEEVNARVEGDRLLLTDTNDCNFVRDYGLTKVFVTSPNLDEIRSSTGLAIESDGILGFDRLTLYSESFLNPESETTDGLFDLELDTENLSIIVNGITYFKLRGNTTNLNLNIAAGDSRIDAENLVAQSVQLNHRGSNDMFVNPRVAITGQIRGTGDVISFNRPAQIEVAELYKGKLIFK